jgi:hypothetical protein
VRPRRSSGRIQAKRKILLSGLTCDIDELVLHVKIRVWIRGRSSEAITEIGLVGGITRSNRIKEGRVIEKKISRSREWGTRSLVQDRLHAGQWRLDLIQVWV